MQVTVASFSGNNVALYGVLKLNWRWCDKERMGCKKPYNNINLKLNMSTI